MTANPTSRYAKLTQLAAESGLRDPEPQLSELERLGVMGVPRYAKKLERLLISIVRKVNAAVAQGIVANIDDGQEEYWALTREGAIAGWLATYGAQVTMEPQSPGPGPDILAECDGIKVYFEVKRLKIVLNPDPVARNARVTDTVTDAHRQLVSDSPNVVVIVDRDPARDSDEVEEALNALAVDAAQAGTLKKLSAVLYEASVAVGTDPWPSGWLFHEFDTGVPLPHCIGPIIKQAFRPRDIQPTDIGDWLSGRRSVLDA